MKTQELPKSNCKIEGEFLGFIPKPGGKLKYIQVQVGERVIPIKLAKELRETMGNSLVKGDRLSIFLESSGSKSISKLKLKSDRIEKININTTQKDKSHKGKVLVCRKSSCTKRGGKKLYRALTETINQLGLKQQVSIKLTDCQKQCKKAPSLILMPGKIKHAYVRHDDLVDLLKAHYC